MKRIELGLRMVALVILAWGVLELRARGDELTDEVNRVRAQHGLHALAHDPALSAWAAENNRFGFGHHVLGPALRQNAAWGIHSVAGVVEAWLRSPGHRAALLASDIFSCGGSYDGSCWTWNAAGSVNPQTSPPAASAKQSITAGVAGVSSAPSPQLATAGSRARRGWRFKRGCR